MKNLTKMLAMAAAVSSMQFAKAEEKVFAPTDRDGAEIDRIELVNGQLLVRAPNAQIDGVKTPYVYVGTNTDHFAVSGFAQGGLTNVATYTHAGNGKIIMTEVPNTKAPSSDIYTTQVSSSPALNGVLSGITKVESDTKSGSSDLSSVMQASIKEGYLTKMFNGELYRVNGDSMDYLIKYDAANKKWDENNSLLSAPNNKQIVDFVITPNYNNTGVNTYIVYDNGDGTKKSHTNVDNTISPINDKSVVSIALADDQETVILTNGGISLYKGRNGKPINNQGVQTKLNQLNTQLGKNSVKSAVIAGDIMYYATAKKLGWIRIYE